MYRDNQGGVVYRDREPSLPDRVFEWTRLVLDMCLFALDISTQRPDVKVSLNSHAVVVHVSVPDVCVCVRVCVCVISPLSPAWTPRWLCSRTSSRAACCVTKLSPLFKVIFCVGVVHYLVCMFLQGDACLTTCFCCLFIGPRAAQPSRFGRR